MSEEMPQSWCVMPLGKVVEVLDRHRVPVNERERAARLERAPERFPYYGATGQVGEIDAFLFDGESILLGEDGAPFLEPAKRKAYLVAGRYWVNNHAHILRAMAPHSNAFVCHQLNTIRYEPFVSGTTRLKLTQAAMLEIPLRVAPPAEQQRIVSRIEELFSEIDDGERALKRVQKLVERHRQSVLKAAVAGELTRDWRIANPSPIADGQALLKRIATDRLAAARAGGGRQAEPAKADATELPSLPAGWAWATVEQLCSVATGATPKRGEAKFYESGSIPWVTSGAVNASRITEPTELITPRAVAETNAKVFPAGTLVVAMYGEGKTRGKVSELGIDAATNQACAALLCGHLEPAIKSYLRLFFEKHYEELRGQAAGGVQPNLNLSIIKQTVLPLPPLAELHEVCDRVASRLSEAEAVSAELGRRLPVVRALRQSVLKAAFSGQLVPQDPADEPAAALLARIGALAGDSPARASRGTRSK